MEAQQGKKCNVILFNRITERIRTHAMSSELKVHSHEQLDINSYMSIFSGFLSVFYKF